MIFLNTIIERPLKLSKNFTRIEAPTSSVTHSKNFLQHRRKTDIDTRPCLTEVARADADARRRRRRRAQTAWCRDPCYSEPEIRRSTSRPRTRDKLSRNPFADVDVSLTIILKIKKMKKKKNFISKFQQLHWCKKKKKRKHLFFFSIYVYNTSIFLRIDIDYIFIQHSEPKFAN